MLNDSYYLFVEVAAQRCSQLMRGAKPKVELRAHKYSTVACAEVSEDLIPWVSATDEEIAEEIAVAAAEEAASQAAMRPMTPQPLMLNPQAGTGDAKG
jgi:DNA-directed RNA polymerase subunit K/omega